MFSSGWRPPLKMSPAIDPRFLDPSGWHPTALHLSVPPEATGLPWLLWFRKQPLCDPQALKAWISINGADAPKKRGK